MPLADPRWAQETKNRPCGLSGLHREPGILPGAFQYGAVMRDLRTALPDDTIVCNGAGNYAGWLHRYYRLRRPHTQLAPTSGSMGYAFRRR